MQNLNTIFIRVLSDFLNEKKSNIEDAIDWKALITLAKKHQVEGIIIHQCKDFLPKELLPTYEQMYAVNIYRYHTREKLERAINDILCKNNIPYFTVKGLNVAKLFPIPSLRTMSDTDYIVPQDKKDEAHKIFTSLGFDNMQKNSMEWIYIKNGFEFEVHDKLLYEEASNSERDLTFANKVWQHVENSGEKMQLNWNYHFVFLMLHLKKHFVNSGVGIRQFMDLTVVARNCNLDWKQVEEWLISLDLLKFSKNCLSLCNRWFGLVTPLNSEMEEGFIKTATNDILRNGVFGYGTEENFDNKYLWQYDEKGKPKNLILFPDYESMVCIRYYSFIKGKKYLLPVAWVYRFCRILFLKQYNRKKRIMTNRKDTVKLIKKRKKYLSTWGIKAENNNTKGV